MKGLSAILWFGLLALAAGTANQCPSEQETNWEIDLLLSHDDCDKFYKCTYGVPVEQACPVGLFFNLEENQCDWKQNVDCTDRNVPAEEKPEPEPEEDVPEPEPEVEEETAPEEEDVPEPEPGTTPEPEQEELAPEPEEVEVAPEPEEEEVAPEPEQVDVAPEPEEEDVAPEPEQVDVAPEPEEEDVAPEPEQVEVAPEPEDEEEEEEEQEIEFLENGCPVNPHVHWLLPQETDCNQFYSCVWGEKVLKQCPNALHFNRAIQVCDWPWDAGCPLALNKHPESRRAILRSINLLM